MLNLAKLNHWIARIPEAPVALMLRVFPALVFWQSGQTKVEGFAIKDSTWFLFEHEYALPLIEVHASTGDNFLGGEDFTEALLKACLGDWGLSRSELDGQALASLLCLVWTTASGWLCTSFSRPPSAWWRTWWVCCSPGPRWAYSLRIASGLLRSIMLIPCCGSRSSMRAFCGTCTLLATTCPGR